MIFQRTILRSVVVAMALAVGTSGAIAGGGPGEARYCMEVDIQPFHMVPGFATELGACAVKDYWGGNLQDVFYPFTKEDHLFNCDYFGDWVPLPTGDMVPSSVVSDGMISGTIGGYPFEAKLFCASLTNWYQSSCGDVEDPSTCSFQLMQPIDFFNRPDPYPRVTEVSVFDGVITVAKGKRTRDVPIVMATRAAGITHIESFEPSTLQVGASVTHSLLGMTTYGTHDGDDVKVLEGSLDLLLQGHIFFPDTVANDKKAARIKGSICSKDLYELLNKPHKGKKHRKGERGGDHHDDD